MARRDLLVDSASPMPWIIYKREFSIVVAPYGEIMNQNLPHGLPFRPLIFGQWSDDANFSPSYDLNVTIPGGGTGGQPETVVNVRADSTNITFNIINNKSTTRTFYFRLMAFAPPDYNGEVNPVDYSSPFRFNSHYRYEQLYMSGLSSDTVSHNLGYLPRAKIWVIDRVTNSVNIGHGILTTTTLKAAYDNTSFYYHIYRGGFDG